MRLFKGLLLVSVVSFLDVVLTTVLYSHGYRFHQTFKLTFFRYSFTSSVFELWILCVLRCSVILGLTLGIIVGRELGINRIKSTRAVSVFLAGVSAMFTLIKLLSISEDSQLLNSTWFWCLFSWTLVSSVILTLQWRILGNICIVMPPVVKINCDGEPGETEALLSDEKNKDDLGKEKDKKARDAKSTILRLFSFSKPDWMFISAGFIFLSLSATGEIFIPFYTGKVVDGIVIDKSQKEFTHAIIVMALISVGSAVTAGLRGGCLFIANRRLNLRVRNALFSSILKQEVGFFDNIQTVH
ncbi:ABC-type oligopeptide transporter ABCB9-like [Ruditapes philippinarum]|uniref:ABC-type oligopeptide transporter ABCB9-like n=1 Tax=Ruditapes philippinarum TaxID=129788 RepID=UPI00295AA103|nr:ABC-type oligopeptide transporter ABCB9-like [Ruditapes philippinarum]